MKHASSKPNEAITDAMVGLTFIESILTADVEKYQMVTQNLNENEIANSLLNACTTVLHYASENMDMNISELTQMIRGELAIKYALAGNV